MGDLSITCSYAPYAGYCEIGLIRYWNELNNHMAQIPNSATKLWMADNNGQICQKESTLDITENGPLGINRK